MPEKIDLCIIRFECSQPIRIYKSKDTLGSHCNALAAFYLLKFCLFDCLFLNRPLFTSSWCNSRNTQELRWNEKSLKKQFVSLFACRLTGSTG